MSEASLTDDTTGDGGSNGDGAPAEQSWHDSLSDEDKGLGEYERFKDVPSLWRGFAETKAMVGANMVKVPGDTATDEEKAQFYSKIGRPNKPDDYQFPAIDGLPSEALPPDRVDDFRRFAHERGLTQKQTVDLFAKYADWYKSDMDSAVALSAQAAQENSDKVKKEHGDAFGQNLAIAKKAVQDLKVAGLPEALTAAGIDNDPAIFNAFLKVGKMMASDTIVTGEAGGFKMGPESAQREIMKMRRDQNFMQDLVQTHRPGHEEAKIRMNELYQQAYPEEP